MFLSLLSMENYGKQNAHAIPNNLQDAINQLDIEFDDPAKLSIMLMDESDFIYDLHLSTGAWIRNTWGIWRAGGALSNFFNDLGFHHPDDMSIINLTCYNRYLKCQNFELEEQLRKYRDSGAYRSYNSLISL